MPKFKNQGLTIVEILVSISVIVILAVMIVPNLSNFRNERTLGNSAEEVISILNKARSDTVSSLNSSVYGVHFETNKATYFVGSTYSSGSSSNIAVNLDSSVSIPSSGGINLNSGGSDVIFTRLTGDTLNYGTIIIQLNSNTTRQKTITISKTGAISSN